MAVPRSCAMDVDMVVFVLVLEKLAVVVDCVAEGLRRGR
jgi:hypothetical protein